MRKKVYYIIGLVVALSFTSCKDMLEEETFGQPTASELLSNPDNVYREVGQIYADLKWLQDHWCYFGISSLSSDEAMLPVRNPGNDWNDNGYWSDFNTMTWDEDVVSFEKVWKYAQQGAVQCNNILADLSDNIEYIDEEVYAAAVSEVIIVRSYYYYVLFDAFGRIPYASNFGQSVTNNPLPEPQTTWINIVSDLLENIDAMPTINNDNRAQYYGRASQGFGYGLLSRLMLNAESFGVNPATVTSEATSMGKTLVADLGISSANDFYTKCIEYCDKVIDSQSYTVESSFFNNFLLYNEGSKENIFVIVNDARNNFDKSEVAGAEMNKNRLSLLTMSYGHEFAYNLIEAPWNGLCARPSYIEKLFGADAINPEHQSDDVRGVCLGTREEGGTKIDFSVEANKRVWFVGPVYYPDDYSNPDLAGTIYKMTDKNNIENVITADAEFDETASVLTTGPNAGARFFKYEIEKNTNVSGGTRQYGENDFVIMRYAEILFNKAEAALRAGDDAALQEVVANADFQTIGTRANAYDPTVYTAPSLDNILDERGREFAWELLRRRDLIRYGQYAEGTWSGKEVKPSYYNWFPIPALYLQNSGGNWKQNPGYKTRY